MRVRLKLDLACDDVADRELRAREDPLSKPRGFIRRRKVFTQVLIVLKHRDASHQIIVGSLDSKRRSHLNYVR